MRLISCALTKAQIADESKLVTRRMGWLHAKVGDYLQFVEKGQGLKKGDTVVYVGRPVELIGVRREHLDAMTADSAYGQRECLLEGFPALTPQEFVEMFCHSHACQAHDLVTRLAFRYVDNPRRPAIS